MIKKEKKNKQKPNKQKTKQKTKKKPKPIMTKHNKKTPNPIDREQILLFKTDTVNTSKIVINWEE